MITALLLGRRLQIGVRLSICFSKMTAERERLYNRKGVEIHCSTLDSLELHANGGITWLNLRDKCAMESNKCKIQTAPSFHGSGVFPLIVKHTIYRGSCRDLTLYKHAAYYFAFYTTFTYSKMTLPCGSKYFTSWWVEFDSLIRSLILQIPDFGFRFTWHTYELQKKKKTCTCVISE